MYDVKGRVRSHLRHGPVKESWMIAIGFHNTARMAQARKMIHVGLSLPQPVSPPTPPTGTDGSVHQMCQIIQKMSVVFETGIDRYRIHYRQQGGIRI